MQTNWPIILTEQKAWALLLLTLLQIKRSNAGQAFKNCLKDRLNDTGAYDNLLKYPFLNGTPLDPDRIAGIDVCCNETSCYKNDYLCNSFYFPCHRVDQSVVCATWISGVVNKECWGVAGDNETTTISVMGSCSSNQLNTTYIASSLLTQPLVGLNQGYALCGDGKKFSHSCMSEWDMCNWDNNGWVCVLLDDICHIRFPASWPGPADKNPMLVQTTTSLTSSAITPTIIQAGTSYPPTPTNPSCGHHCLAEKIAIPVGVVTGTSLISGLTYYYCKKRRGQQQLEVTNADNLESDSTPLGSPTSQASIATNQLIKQLRMELVGKEQLWNDYLEINKLLISNPQSQLINNEFTRVHNELLKTFTVNDLNLLLENEHHNHTHSPLRNPHTDYSETTGEARNPHTEYFEIGVNN